MAGVVALFFAVAPLAAAAEPASERPQPRNAPRRSWTACGKSRFSIPRSISLCMLVSLRPGSCRRRGFAATSGPPWTKGRADRIGHGVDIMYEDRPYELLKEMAAKRVVVEIAFTSNDLVVGVPGKQHPFSLYRKLGVPVAPSTDDEGVSRIDLTHEYVRAVETYGLSYADLKQLVRNSLEYSLLPARAFGPVRTLPASPKPARTMPSGQTSRPQPVRPSSRGAKRPSSNGSSNAGLAFSKQASNPSSCRLMQAWCRFHAATLCPCVVVFRPQGSYAGQCPQS
jgi:Adenosine deaminase